MQQSHILSTFFLFRAANSDYPIALRHGLFTNPAAHTKTGEVLNPTVAFPPISAASAPTWAR